MNKRARVGDRVVITDYLLDDLLKGLGYSDWDIDKTDHKGEKGTVKEVFNDGYAVVLDSNEHTLFFLDGEVSVEKD